MDENLQHNLHIPTLNEDWNYHPVQIQVSLQTVARNKTESQQAKEQQKMLDLKEEFF